MKGFQGCHLTMAGEDVLYCTVDVGEPINTTRGVRDRKK